MANEDDSISPRKTMFVLVVVVGCFAVLWPRLLYPMFVGNVKDQLKPNKLDKDTGCCNMIFETDLNAIRIMIELCGNVLERQGKVDERTELAFRSGKLPRDIINKCREEVNDTCGVDISIFLDTNIRLGKTHKQLLDEVRSFNSSNCLKINYGVSPWALGVPHVVHSWSPPESADNYMRQERSPYMHPTVGPHPAMLERGRAIATPTRSPAAVLAASSHTPTPPSQGPVPIARRSPDGRVRHQPYTLTDIYHKQDEPIVPGMRPPMGGAGQIVPPPKSATMGLFMPIYTTAVVVFFVYTLSKLLFRSHKPDDSSPYEYLESDPEFRRRVFQNEAVGRSVSSKCAPEPAKLVVSAISGLVAEVRQQMEEPKPAQRTDIQQDPFNDIHLPHKNGSIKYPSEEKYITNENNTYYSDIPSESSQVERPPIKDLVVEEETTPQLELERVNLLYENYTHPDQEWKEPSPEILVSANIGRDASPEAEEVEDYREGTPEIIEIRGNSEEKEIIEQRELTPELKEPSPDINDWTPIITESSPKEVSPEPEELVEEYEIENEMELLQKSDVLFRELTPRPNDLVVETKEIANELQEAILEAEEAEAEDRLLDELIDDLNDDAFIEKLKEDEDIILPTPDLKEDSPAPVERSPERQQSPVEVKDDYEHVAVHEEEERPESPVHRQFKLSKEKDRATVKVLGMEMTASCSDGAAWGSRPLSSPGPHSPHSHSPLIPRPRTPSPPVSAIFLEGPALPHQSRLLVTDSETSTEAEEGDAPVVLSGKMTLSVINDESAKSTPERDSEDTVNGGEDDDFLTASAATAPKQTLQDDEEVSEEEVEEDIEDEEEEVEEVEEEEIEELEDEVKVQKAQ